MKTVPYSEIEALAGDLSGRMRDKLPTSEATMLRAFFAEELADLWTREAWPELCDNLEAVTLDADNCFSTREGDADEMGDILALTTGGDPRTATGITRLPADEYGRLDGRVHVLSSVTGGLWVDWQLPAPDLLDNTALGIANDAALAAYEIPARFKLPLAARGAALLLSEEDPAQAGVLRGLAEQNLLRQTARIQKPWWRK